MDTRTGRRDVGNQVKGGWMQFKGKLKEKWGDLTDDELDRVQGQRDQLAGIIARKSGQDRGIVDRDLDKISRDTGYNFR